MKRNNRVLTEIFNKQALWNDSDGSENVTKDFSAKALKGKTLEVT